MHIQSLDLLPGIQGHPVLIIPKQAHKGSVAVSIEQVSKWRAITNTRWSHKQLEGCSANIYRSVIYSLTTYNTIVLYYLYIHVSQYRIKWFNLINYNVIWYNLMWYNNILCNTIFIYNVMYNNMIWHNIISEYFI